MKNKLILILLFSILLQIGCDKANKDKEIIDDEKTTTKSEFIEKIIIDTKIEDIKRNTQKVAEFKSNVSENMLEVKTQDIDDINIVKDINPETVINKCNRLPDDFKVKKLVPVNHFGYRDFLLEEEAAKNWEKLFSLSKEKGLKLILFDAYRTPEQQQGLFDYNYGVNPDWALKYIASKRHSEHEMGYAVDISDTETFPVDFYNGETGKFLDKYAHEFGFILRYHSDKEKITGIKYESWHYRYVGLKLAKILKEKSITMEEYYNLVYKGS